MTLNTKLKYLQKKDLVRQNNTVGNTRFPTIRCMKPSPSKETMDLK